MGSKNGQHGIRGALGDPEQDAGIVGPPGDGYGKPGEPGGATPGEVVASLAGRTEKLDFDPADIPPDDVTRRAEGMLSLHVRHWGHPDDPLRASHPTLAWFLFAKSWDGIAPREPGVLTIAVKPTGLTATLKMPSEAQSLSITVSFSTHIFDALERCLRTREGDWKELKAGPGAQKLREDRKKLLETRKPKR
jgi:hypothetical protein